MQREVGTEAKVIRYKLNIRSKAFPIDEAFSCTAHPVLANPPSSSLWQARSITIFAF
jgi:hypothetical protein